ncbi:MAG: glutamate synthase subunit beta [Bacteroidota bacterium]
MGQVDGFLKYNRELPKKIDPKNRVQHSGEFYEPLDDEKTNHQAARCMDCGIPFCHGGCPLGNKIPEFNEAVYQDDWKKAISVLQSTNNFPEFTGRICPAPCEASCVLSINNQPVAIEHIEKTIAEKAFELGYIKPLKIKDRTGKKVAIVGSGPAGLAAAQQLNKVGHLVTVFEKDDQIGGLLRYGIPDFKMEKWTIDRRISLMEEEGVKFVVNTCIGKDVSKEELMQDFDAVLIAIGCLEPRDLEIQGRNLEGIHFAMDYLTQQNRRVANLNVTEELILAKDKHVIVIGGGDTGSDCVGTSNRQGATSVTQLQYHDKPSNVRSLVNPWPEWPMTLTTSTSHEEGCERSWSVLTKSFVSDEEGHVKGLKIVKLKWSTRNGRTTYTEVPNSEQVIPCDLALIAIGYSNPVQDDVIKSLEVETGSRGTIPTKKYQTNIENVFAAGDVRRGQSIVVWAISEGREAARQIDEYLMGYSNLETKNESLASLKN